MAVTKIRKISSWTLIVIVLVSVAMLGLFYFGGLDEPLNGEWKNPIYTGHILVWTYILLALCAVSMILFGLVQFVNKFRSDPKGALGTLAVLIVFAALLIVAYTVGNGTPLAGLNADSQSYNTPFWLKVTDMWLITMYTLLVLAVIAMIWGSVKKLFSK